MVWGPSPAGYAAAECFSGEPGGVVRIRAESVSLEMARRGGERDECCCGDADLTFCWLLACAGYENLCSPARRSVCLWLDDLCLVRVCVKVCEPGSGPVSLQVFASFPCQSLQVNTQEIGTAVLVAADRLRRPPDCGHRRFHGSRLIAGSTRGSGFRSRGLIDPAALVLIAAFASLPGFRCYNCQEQV